jgi:hypothetical protein
MSSPTTFPRPLWLPLAAALVTLLAAPAARTAATSAANDEARIDFATAAPAGLVGNGHSVVIVQPDGYAFHAGGDGAGSLRVELGGAGDMADAAGFAASFFPGGVIYTADTPRGRVEILHGALPDVPYLVAVRVSGAADGAAVVLESSGTPAPAVSGRQEIPLRSGSGELVLAFGAPPPPLTWAQLRERLGAPYREGLTLHTPSRLADRAVPFCRWLLDLGFDGRLHVCEIFRWRDVWSRDLGSGLVPGAMASGRFAAARTTLDYDLGRHAAADPRGLKVTQDPSQGGSAEGVAWLTRAVWRDYLLTGDRERLRAAAATLRPWVRAWLDRDADGSGLLVDVTEWMDHSRFFLFPDGARVLYSNVLFAELLHRFAGIERELGDEEAAQSLGADGDRFAAAINATLWDEELGAYDNLSLWGLPDRRVSAGENALAVLGGVATRDRARRALATVRETNWRRAGSTTIYPPMTHVPAYIDHNYRFWPWWNAVEARARFRIGDREGALHLLECCSATLDDEHYPGLMEELTTPEGVTEGGFAFLTAAGAYLDAVVEGLLGVEILEPGCRRLRVAPNAPADWRDWRAEVPLPEGTLRLTVVDGRLSVEVTDPRVLFVEVPGGAGVSGAAAASLSPESWPASTGLAPTVAPPPAPRARRGATLVTGLPAELAPPLPPAAATGLPTAQVTLKDLPRLDPARVGALVIAGNALPQRTPDGHLVTEALADYLARGGAVVFYGATMVDRGTMGEYSGVIEWYDQRPELVARPCEGWEFRRSFVAASVRREDEPGSRGGWQHAQAPDTAWAPIIVPAGWEAHLGHEYDGWAWYRARFSLPAEARGRPVVLDLGRIDDSDWTWVNGVLVGSRDNWQALRRYRLQPQDAAYAGLVFGGENHLAIQVLDTGGGGGLYAGTPRVGWETERLAWTPIEPRSGEPAPGPSRLGVVSWGPGGRFFNSWETSRGAFGFHIEGRGIAFLGPLADLPAQDVPVGEAFTDFAVSRPWRFEPLAFTHTQRHLLVPDGGERYPCAARLVDTRTGGEIWLIGASVAATPAGPAALRALGLEESR